MFTTPVRTLHFITLCQKLYGKVMSRDVPICNVLAICREVLNCENLEVLHIGKCFISWDALFYDCNNILQNEGLKKDQIYFTLKTHGST